MKYVVMLLRVFLGVALALFAILSALTGLYFLSNRDAQAFGSGGVLMLLSLLIAAGLSVISWKLSRRLVLR